MASKLAPTRGNLVKLSRSIKVAQSGHKLLDQKRQVLMMELIRYMDTAKKLQEEVAQVFKKAYSALQKANISLGVETVEDIANSVPEMTDLVIRLRSVMGVEVCEVDPINPNPAPVFSFYGSSGTMDNAYVAFHQVMVTLARLAEVETSVYRLAVQIRKTHRRVNALEKVVIPMAKKEILFISDVLEEGEREDFVRMKMAKASHEKGG